MVHHHLPQPGHRPARAPAGSGSSDHDEIVGAEQARHLADGGARLDAHPTPEQQVLTRARDHRLVEAVRTLRPDQQSAWCSGSSRSCPWRTAKALGRSEGAVKQLQLRAVRQLAALLGELP